MAKAKISVTLDRKLIDRLNRMAKGSTRSELVERAVSQWLVAEDRHRLETEIEHYYSSLRPEERQEDAAWARRTPKTIRSTWK